MASSTSALFGAAHPQMASAPAPQMSASPFQPQQQQQQKQQQQLRRRESASSSKTSAVVGTANAARVSRGSEEKPPYAGLEKTDVERDANQNVTVTLTMYYLVAGGIPSEADVRAAIDDIQQLYSSCAQDKRLVDATEITKEMTPMDFVAIQNKLKLPLFKQPVPQLINKKMMRCRNNHALEAFDRKKRNPNADIFFFCDICAQKIDKPDGTCVACDFDVCRDCRWQFTAPPPPAKCANGHTLCSRFVAGGKCDGCNKDVSQSGAMACAADDFDLCPSCYWTQAKAQYGM